MRKPNHQRLAVEGKFRTVESNQTQRSMSFRQFNNMFPINADNKLPLGRNPEEGLWTVIREWVHDRKGPRRTHDVRPCTRRFNSVFATIEYSLKDGYAKIAEISIHHEDLWKSEEGVLRDMIRFL